MVKIKNLHFWIFWSPLAVAAVFAGWKWWNTPSSDNALFFGFMLILISVLYAVVVLDLVVTNNTVKKAEATKGEIKNIADLIVKTAFVLSDGSSRYGGTPPEHIAKLQEYTHELAVITNRNEAELMEQVHRTLQELNDAIQRRIQSEKK